MDDDAQVAGRAAVGAGQAVAAQGELAAGLDAGGKLDLALALVAGDLDLAPSIASTAEISTAWIRSWPRIGPRRTSKPKLPPKKAWKMSSTEPKPPGAEPAPRNPSGP